MIGECLVPAPQAGQQGYFLRSDNIWAEQSDKAKFLCSDGTWKTGDNNHLFLQGNAQYGKMQLGMPLGNLPVNAKVRFGRFFDAPIVWVIGDKNHEGFPANSVTLVSDKILMTGPYDARESTNPDENCAKSGNSDYDLSNARQWLNSDAPAGQWYSPQHAYDAPPTPENLYSGYDAYADKYGFLYQFTNAEKQALLNTNRVWQATAGHNMTCVDRMFLLTLTETGALTPSFAPDGVRLAMFSEYHNGAVYNATRIAYPTPECVAHSHQGSSGSPTIEEGHVWATATTMYTTTRTSTIYRITKTGSAENGASAYAGQSGIRPACNLSSSTLVSTTADSDGCYNILL